MIVNNLLHLAVTCGLLLLFSPANLVPIAVTSSQQLDGNNGRIVSLTNRVNDYLSLIRDRDYPSAYEMLASRVRDRGDDSRHDWIRSVRKMDNGIKLVSWRIQRIWTHENQAKVNVRIRAKTRESFFHWEDSVDEQNDYWTFENDNWYYIPFHPREWDPSDAVEVPVPKTQVNVEIEEGK